MSLIYTIHGTDLRNSADLSAAAMTYSTAQTARCLAYDKLHKKRKGMCARHYGHTYRLSIADYRAYVLINDIDNNC